MSHSWPGVRLGDVLRKVPRPVEVKPDTVYREIGIRSHGKGVFHKPPVSGLELGSKKVFWVEPGDFVLNIVFAWEGAVAVLADTEAGMIGSHRFPTFRADEARLNPRFLLAYFKTPEGLDLLGRVSPGGAGRNRTLSRTAFLAQTIPLPSPEEQCRIVARIEEVSIRVEEARSLRTAANQASEMLESSSARIIIDNLAHHGTRPLRDLVRVKGGGTPSSSNPSFWQGPIPWICPKDMKRRNIVDSIDHISEEAAENSPAKLLAPGSVLIVVRGMILAHTVPSAVLGTPAAINQDMKALIPAGAISPCYLCNALWALNQSLLALVERSSHDTRKLETPKLLAFHVPVPPLTEQERVTEHIECLRSQVAKLNQLQKDTSQELTALMPSILSKAFSGEL